MIEFDEKCFSHALVKRKSLMGWFLMTRTSSTVQILPRVICASNGETDCDHMIWRVHAIHVFEETEMTKMGPFFCRLTVPCLRKIVKNHGLIYLFDHFQVFFFFNYFWHMKKWVFFSFFFLKIMHFIQMFRNFKRK